MSFCPFMSKPDGINSTMDKLYPCIKTCELYTGSECSFRLLAKSQYQIAKNSIEKDDKS